MTSRLVQMQARFQQKQMHEKEEKLLRLYESQQQRAFERVGRGSAGSTSTTTSTSTTLGGGKVRQMFDERRLKAGIDRSYPLEPLKSTKTRNGSVDRQKSNSGGTTIRTTVKSTVQKGVSQMRNGKPVVNKREIVHSIYNNNDGDETYEEQRYEDDMVDMLNKQNLNGNLDDEQIPQIGFEHDEPFFKGKLANVGGKLPSQNGITKSEMKTTPTKTNGITSTLKKEQVKPSTKRTPPQRTSPTVQSPSPKSGSIMSSPIKSASKPSTINSNNRRTPTTPRAPSSAKPSASQTPKSSVVRDDLDECKFCGRRFASDRLGTHENICGKTAQKKRKIYDATKHRVQGTEMEQYTVKGKPGKTAVRTSTKSTAKKDWRTTHEEFIAAIRAAKMAQAHIAKGGKLSDLPPPPPSSNPDYVQCPHCGRRFNEAAAARHIPKCATYTHNKPKPVNNRNSRR